MAINYFDIHSHLYFPDYDTDREDVIAHMKERGIYTTAIGTDIETSKKAIELAEQHENIFASIGVHPAHDLTSGFSPEFEALAKHPKVVAIGECGFDFFRTESADLEKAKADQRKIFEQQVDLAIRYGKALMIHARSSKGSVDAYEETLAVLEPLSKIHGDKLFGNAHFFAGNMDILKRFLAIGFTVSFTGVITFVPDYDELVVATPLDRIHAETDAPYVAPKSHRGKRNSPEYVPEVVEAIARLKNLPVEKVKSTLISNAKTLFRYS